MLKSFIVVIFACNHAGTACSVSEKVHLAALNEADCIAMSHEIAATHATDSPVSAYECRAEEAAPPLEPTLHATGPALGAPAS